MNRRRPMVLATMAAVSMVLALAAPVAAAPADYSAFVEDGISTSHAVYLMATPADTVGAIGYGPTGGFSLLFSGPGESVFIQVAPPTGGQLVAGTYVTSDTVDATHALFDGDPGGCQGESGTLDIQDIHFAADGSLTTLTASFTTQGCNQGVVHNGELRFQSSVAYWAPSVGPYQVNLGQVKVGTSASATATLTNKGTASLGVGAGSIAGPHASEASVTATTCPAQLAPGASCTLTVTTVPFVRGIFDDTYVNVAVDTPQGYAGTQLLLQTGDNADGTYGMIRPARFMDTRSNGKTVDGLFAGKGALAAGETRVLQVAGRALVPAASLVSAVVVNVTVVRPTSNGYLAVFPASSTRPTVSSINFVHGEIRANLITVPLDASGRLAIYNPAGATHVLMDVMGYYRSASGLLDSEYEPVVPTRMLDTRSKGGKLPGGYYLTLGMTTPVTAAALNVTATGGSAPGYLSAWTSWLPSYPVGVSMLDYGKGQTVANTVIVGLSQNTSRRDYEFSVGNFGPAGVHVIVDLVGVYIFNSDGMHFHPVTPVRILDSRSGLGVPAALGPASTAVVTSSIGDAHTHALVMNVTGVHPTASTYLSLAPGTSGRPSTSSVNVPLAGVVANMVMCGLDSSSRFAVYNSAGTVDVVADLSGYFDGEGINTPATPVTINENPYLERFSAIDQTKRSS